MKMNMRAKAVAIAAAIGATAFFAPLAHAETELFQLPVTEDFGEGALNWNGGAGKGFVYRMKVINHKGNLAVCGAGTYPDVMSRDASRRVMRRMEVQIDGKTFIKDLTFFSIIKKNTPLVGAMANCRDSGVKVPPGKSHKLTIKGDGRAYRM